jgi:3-oxoacyl-[acyl-carrier protein] reductase
MPADVTDEEPVRALFDPAVDAHGRVDLLFDDAGSFDTAQDAGDRQP